MMSDVFGSTGNKMKIAVAGCAHGELEAIYNTIKEIENLQNIKIELLICCGDFQATRNLSDLKCMAVPEKYSDMGSFHKYYSGREMAPVLTIFIGGNHEASNYLQELEFGGWVAPNIYFMGYANIVNICGIRIAGISGIYKEHDYMKGHYEKSPYNNETKRSVYHMRNTEVFRLKQVQEPIDIMISHDWPRGIYYYGNTDMLIKRKPFFKNEVNENSLGSQPLEELLFHLKPKYWFSAHLHTKFAAMVTHEIDKSVDEKQHTKFLALDKCLPGRDFLQVLDIPRNDDGTEEICLNYDLEWLAILYSTNHLGSTKKYTQYMPGRGSDERWEFTPTEEEKQKILLKLNNSLQIPTNFVKTAPIYDQSNVSLHSHMNRAIHQPIAKLNPQTSSFCCVLGIESLMSRMNIGNDSFNDSNISGFSTPDSSFNSSFIRDSVVINNDSFSDNDGGLGTSFNSTTVNCSDTCFESTRFGDSVEEADNSSIIEKLDATRSRVSLSLPSPKFNDSVSTSDLGNTSEIMGQYEISDSPCSSSSIPNSNLSLPLSKIDQDSDLVSSTSTTLDTMDVQKCENRKSVTTKLMKRRNQSVYNRETDE